MREASISVWAGPAARFVIAAIAFTLLFTSAGAFGPPAAGADLIDEISVTRRGQLQSEMLMRKYDRAIAKIDRKRDKLKRQIKRNVRQLGRLRKRYRAANAIFQVRQQRLVEAEAKFPDATEAPNPEIWADKLRKWRRDVRLAQDTRRMVGNRIRKMDRARKARVRRLAKLRHVRRKAGNRRAAVESVLGASIVRMTSLAQERAARHSDVRLSSDSNAFAWPSVGRISQGYGCTGFYLSPPRGSCRHFHDGVDIVSGLGSPVKAAAVGVVAYVGWNPWDKRGRAFIVVIGHAGGYVTRYGHLLPHRKVRPGQLVHKGQVIGKMGNTGRSTGTHLHLELLHGTTPLNPFDYLPKGVVDYRKPGKHKADRNKAAKKKAAKKRKARARQRASREAKTTKAQKDRRSPLEASAEVGASAEGLTGVETSAVLPVDESCQPLEPVTSSLAVLPASPAGRADLDGSVVAEVARPALVGRCPGEPGLGSPPEPDSPPQLQDRKTATDAPRSASTKPPKPSPGVDLPLRGTSPVPQ